VKILVLAASYPHSGHLFAGSFNEKSVLILNDLCDAVEVLTPRPYVPLLLGSAVPRWKAYAIIAPYEKRNGITVYRPAYVQIPRVGGAFWSDPGIFLWCRRVAKNMHRRMQFDAIISYDLVGAGGFAWRLGRELGIPASGWATGSDVRVSASSSYAKVVIRAIEHLDFVFYQSHELLEKAAELLGISPDLMLPDRHMVLPRGIPTPPSLSRIKVREQVRREWDIADDQVVVLNVGRVTRAKGVFELLQAISLAAAQEPRITCVLVGSMPAFDETTVIQKKLKQTPGLRERVRLIPGCSPHKVWEYLCAADIFAFASHNEGMPNGLLEAMAMGLPAVAFAIPPVQAIEAETGALLTVPPLNSTLFSEAILRLAVSPGTRSQIGERGKAQVMHRFMMRNNMAKALQRLAQVGAKQHVSRGKSHLHGINLHAAGGLRGRS
jgi:teichuronic acid biosynthesis glycosyltransferase TuaC